MLPAPNEPRSLRDLTAVAKRRELLAEQSARTLADYVMRLRAMGRGEVPDFDPLDGGHTAKVLFLFEKPGPMTSLRRGQERKGSGFISRDNDDPTAEATFLFMRKAGLDRRLTTVWNMVPWWNGTRAIKAEELHAGTTALDELLKLMENLRVVVLVGRKAARARSHLEGRGIPVLQSPHPSPIVRASRLSAWQSIPEIWAEVLPFVQPPRT
jgi:hypothetical protein